ncbi:MULTISPECIES: MlaD family protein [Sphingomonas]|jgi:phospholipid/cholesterol/gamma-HCH transport system substrate-binding protein|uniref:MlaD family protein n=3 Tax=Pseudomonadota TaxID=1224 RepID=A0ABU4PHW4_9SPHN|nr:MlaD family protein [Sphingomonas echinoides]MDX5983554.1 MlaD family protein [Sphingomonas echinoides]
METRSNHVLVGTVVLILIAVMLLFLVWIARWGTATNKEYDIFFKQSVDGLVVGSTVAFSGVQSGQVKEMSLWKPDPQLVRVRISVNADTPILVGTTATLQGSFTGTSTVQLDGAIKGAPPITCPAVNPLNDCPNGVPTIPTKAGGLGALLSSAPQLLERISTLTEKLSDVLSEKNQQSITGILANTNRLTKALADRGPDIAATLAETKVTLQKAGVAAEQIGKLADTTNGLLKDDVHPVMGNLNKAIASAQHSMETLDAAVSDARPGLQAFSKQTIPEVGQLVHDLRQMSQALTSVAEKLDRGGASSLIGQSKLPDYKPGKGQ